jgi:hypothetical protein
LKLEARNLTVNFRTQLATVNFQLPTTASDSPVVASPPELGLHSPVALAAAAAAERIGDVAAFALLQEDRDDQQPAHEDVHRHN